MNFEKVFTRTVTGGRQGRRGAAAQNSGNQGGTFSGSAEVVLVVTAGATTNGTYSFGLAAGYGRATP